jgi:hypothetical protein
MMAALKSACSSEDSVNFRGGLRADMSLEVNRGTLVAGDSGEVRAGRPLLKVVASRLTLVVAAVMLGGATMYST